MVNEIQLIENVLNIIYPPTCGICGKLNEDFLCNKCKKHLVMQAKFGIEKYEDKYFKQHLYVFEYQGLIRKLMLDYKFNDRSYLYKTVVNFLLNNEKLFKILQSYDTIVPAPISKKRNKQRGYNQSYLIAKEISKLTGVQLESTCLLKSKDIIEQSKLNKEERQKNIQGAYELLYEERLENKKILFVDDIYTTGSTANECCKVLSIANPKEIDVFTVAKD